MVFVVTMELQKRHRCLENEATPVSDSISASSASDHGSAFEAVEEGTENFPNSPSLSLEAEVSGSNGDVHIPES